MGELLLLAVKVLFEKVFGREVVLIMMQF